MHVKSALIGFQRAKQPEDIEERGRAKKSTSEVGTQADLMTQENSETDRFQRSIGTESIPDDGDDIQLKAEDKPKAKSDIVSATESEADENTTIKRNSSVNYAGPVIVGGLGGAALGICAGIGTSLLSPKASKTLCGIGVLAGTAIGAAIYGIAASSSKVNPEGYKYSKEEFANSKINSFRSIAGLLRDDEIHNINKYGIVPENTKIAVNAFGGIYRLQPDWFGFSLGTKTVPEGFEAKKDIFGFAAVYPKGSSSFFVK